MGVEEERRAHNILLGAILRQLRESSTLSKKDVASTLGVSTGTISSWENGESSIDIWNMRQLGLFLETPPDELHRLVGVASVQVKGMVTALGGTWPEGFLSGGPESARGLAAFAVATILMPS